MTRNNGSQNPLERVAKLVKKPILYKEDGYVLPRPTNYIGAHGTHVKNIVDLARKGQFVDKGGHLEGEFYITPNFSYPDWAKHGLADDLAQYDRINPFEVAIEFSETVTVDEAHHGQTVHEADDGVVVVFSPLALENGAEVSFGQELNTAELVLPKAPRLEAVRWIYPVGVNAAEMLHTALGELRKQKEQ